MVAPPGLILMSSGRLLGRPRIRDTVQDAAEFREERSAWWDPNNFPSDDHEAAGPRLYAW